METLSASFKKDKKLHHAYLIPGEREAEITAIISFLKKELTVEPSGNPDLVVMRLDTFGIDEARELKSFASRKEFKGAGKFFIVAAHFLTREAQNSLLKLFEEPSPRTHFFLITEHREIIVPTLLSRLAVLAPAERPARAAEAASRFLSLSPSERLEEEHVKELIEEKDKEKASRFIDALMQVLHKRLGKKVSEENEAFEALLLGRRFINDRSASVKLILEHLSLTLPTIEGM